MTIDQLKTARSRTLTAVNFGALSHEEAMPIVVQHACQALDMAGVKPGCFQITGKKFDEIMHVGSLKPHQVAVLKELGYKVRHEVCWGDTIQATIELF